MIKTGMDQLEDVVLPDFAKTTCNSHCYDDTGKVKKEYAIDVADLYGDFKSKHCGHSSEDQEKKAPTPPRKDSAESSADSSKSPRSKDGSAASIDDKGEDEADGDSKKAGAHHHKTSSDPNDKNVIDSTVRDIVSDLKNKKH